MASPQKIPQGDALDADLRAESADLKDAARPSLCSSNVLGASFTRRGEYPIPQPFFPSPRDVLEDGHPWIDVNCMQQKSTICILWGYTSDTGQLAISHAPCSKCGTLGANSLDGPTSRVQKMLKFLQTASGWSSWRQANLQGPQLIRRMVHIHLQEGLRELACSACSMRVSLKRSQVMFSTTPPAFSKHW